MIDLDKVVILDIETMKNMFCVCVKNYKTKERKEFIFFDDDEYLTHPSLLNNFLVGCRKHEYHIVTFNGISFDSQVLDCFLDVYKNEKETLSISTLIKVMYAKAQELISAQQGHYIETKPEYKLFNKQIDLFRQKNYGNKARITSLKWLQFSMRLPNIQEMPIHHGSDIKKEDIPKILEYCWNDVNSTETFYDKIMFETTLRKSLSEEYSLSLMSASEPKLVKSILGKFLMEELEIPRKELMELRTHRDEIDFNNIIFPYIKFHTPVFQKVFEDIKKVKIDVNHASFTYSFKYKGCKIDLGLGGAHAANMPGLYEEDIGWEILDIDVN
jgi:hypothetical protein